MTSMKEFNVVGKPVRRQDAYEKVTGTALYAADYKFPGMLYGVPVRIPSAHATIKAIDYSAILGDSSLTAICDHTDIKGAQKVGPIKQDQPIFCSETIVTPGDVISLLVGENEDALAALRKKIVISYDELPVLTDPTKALDADAPLIHPGFGSNLINHYPLRRGDLEKGFAESDHILEETYTTQCIEHAYIEPEAVIAVWMGPSKGIKIIGSIQNPHTTRNVVSKVLGLPLTKVRVIQAELGGSFGGKDDTMNILSARAAVAAIKTGHPVKICYSREDSILESYKRHPYHMKYKVGFSKEGKLKAMKIDIIADGGAYSSMSPFVTWRTVVQATGPYEVENVSTDVRAVYTNNPYTGAMRGFGSPQPIFAQESIMDEIAIRVGKDPLSVRLLNGFQLGSVTASGQVLKNHDVNLHKVLHAAVEKTDFTNAWTTNLSENKEVPAQLKKVAESSTNSFLLAKEDLISPGQTLRKGIGLACSYRGCSLGAEGVDGAGAYFSLQNDGSAYLLCGLAENGQGLHTTFNIIAAEVLGIDPNDITYLDHDTSVAPDSGPTVASRSTLMGGGAVKHAADTIRMRLEEVLREEWELKKSAKLVFANNKVICKTKKKEISFPDLCMLAYKKGVSLATIGWYKGPNVHWEEETGQGDAYFTYVYGCHLAEITLDIATGVVNINRVVAVHDPGKVINLQGALGQVYGGVTQGAGYGVVEEISSHNGVIREMNFDQYILLTSKDIDVIEPIFIEGDEPYGAWGGKSLGEPTLELTAAAIANAIRNATGERFYNLPVNLEEVLLRKKLYPEALKRGSM